jgi:hypothetical protein
VELQINAHRQVQNYTGDITEPGAFSGLKGKRGNLSSISLVWKLPFGNNASRLGEGEVRMNKATQNAKVDPKANRDELSSEFYNTGMSYIIALDEWIESQGQESKSVQEVAIARDRKRIIETFLHKLYPDEFADTCSAAE